jgi:hypothetical protein
MVKRFCIRTLSVVLLAVGLTFVGATQASANTPGTAQPAGATEAGILEIGETFADIACFPGADYVKTKGWGVDGPRNTRIHVYRSININNQWWRTDENWVYSTSTGSWSVPTSQLFTFLTGNYRLSVGAAIAISDTEDGAIVGYDQDECNM